MAGIVEQNGPEMEGEEDGATKSSSQVPTEEQQLEIWAPWALVVPTKNPHAPPPVAVRTTPGPAWDIGQVVKAARLLNKPPMPVDFTDEQEMRCVYSLIYDVFRYKSIMEQAIEDVEFMSDHPEFGRHRHSVWLFLMELARRRWGARPRSEMDRAAKLIEEAGSPFKEIENTIWEERVHLAAAIARIRIKNRAITLTDLLPPHLREERISACVNKETVTGWVNTFKAKKVAQLVKRLHEIGYSYSNSRQLCAGEYRFDRVCPRFITLRPPENHSVGQLDLVKDGVIVLQEREFCEGASTLCRALRANSLRGIVAQTHASSPRCSAYLAAQLRELAAVLKLKTPPAPATPELGKLVVFGAGDKVSSYILALRELGIDASDLPQSPAPVRVISEPVYCDTPTVTNALDGVVAVLATPPNSYSAVTDPIDLVCGRGGDLAMLEILTESEMDTNGKARVQTILEEQKKTLKTLMSKPQIQLILYETHSALEAENQAQITRAVAEANRLARERHALLKKKHRIASPQKHTAEAAKIESMSSIDDTISPISQSGIIKNQADEISIAESIDTPRRPESSSRPSSTMSSKRSKLHSADLLKKQVDKPEVHSGPGTDKARPIPAMPGTEFPSDPNKDSPNIIVPNCDLFEIRKLPNLGNGLDINYILDRDGCYLGLIQRKEITRLDAKFMICVAEERGLFGQTAAAAPPPRRKRAETAQISPRRRKRKSSFEVERVAAPTYASLSRSMRRGSAPASVPGGAAGGAEGGAGGCGAGGGCERHARRQAAAAATVAATCVCDAKHRCRRASHGSAPSVPLVARQTPAQCRRPFPVVITDLRLKTVLPRSKIMAT